MLASRALAGRKPFCFSNSRQARCSASFRVVIVNPHRLTGAVTPHPSTIAPGRTWLRTFTRCRVRRSQRPVRFLICPTTKPAWTLILRAKPMMSRSAKNGAFLAMNKSNSPLGTQKSAAASLAARSSIGSSPSVAPSMFSSMISRDCPSFRRTCSISCRRTNQKLSMRSCRIRIPITGDCLSNQKQTPSILVLGRHSTTMNLTPHSAMMRGTLRVSSGSTRYDRRRTTASRRALSEYFATTVDFAI